MIIVTTAHVTAEHIDRIVEHVESAGLRAHIIRGEQRTVSPAEPYSFFVRSTVE